MGASDSRPSDGSAHRDVAGWTSNGNRSRRGALRLAVVSPAGDDPREIAFLESLQGAGPERYQVRKPGMSRDALRAWLRGVPPEMYPRLVLHQHHELATEFGIGGCHWRDDGAAPAVPPAGGVGTSRSCHHLDALVGALGRYDAAFFGPVFPSLSKPGRGPPTGVRLETVAALLAGRSTLERSTAVFALGGVTAARLPRVHALGFDGAAVLGAVWQAPDPVAAFRELQEAALGPSAMAFDP